MFRPFLQLRVRHERKVSAVIGLILFLFTSVFAYSDGNGTEGNPYQISNVSDWNDLMKTSSDWKKYFIMTADLDLQGVALTPVGFSTNFTGVFDGNEYVIYNADMNMPAADNIGLFGRVGAAGRISNLGIEKVKIKGRNYVGGLAGANYGTVADCYAEGAVTGSSTYVGGLTGRNSGTISGCYIVIIVTGSSNYVGGLAGNNTSTIQLCYAAGSVTGSGSVGGLAGVDSGNITSCYAAGAVNGNSSVGGFAGSQSGGTINICYSAGSVNGNSSVGGFLGSKSSGSVSNCFWDVNTSGRQTSAGGVGKTTAQMQDITTFAGWDFTTPVWKICNSTNYPKLAWQIPAGDFVCPDGVDFYDLAVLTDQWLLEKLLYDVAPGENDGIVNFLDWAVFANNWQGKMTQLSEFTSQWLKQGAYADIAPWPDGDGIVNMLDFAVFADDWLEGT